MIVWQKFDEIDTDSNRLISYEEASRKLNSTGLASARRKRGASWFDEMDTNGDGHIEPFEFDSSL